MVYRPGPLLKRGSSKDIHEVPGHPSFLDFVMRDCFSVFDVGASPQEIPGKAKALTDCAVKTFEIANRLNVPTHFVERMDDVTIRVLRAEIIGNRALTDSDRGCVIPGEWIDRSCAAGRILRDFRSGKKLPIDFGFPSNKVPQEGEPFPAPVHQFTTKFEKIDRELTHQEALLLCGLTLEEEAHVWEMVDALNAEVRRIWNEAGYERFDGKKEFMRARDGQILLADVACTPDEDRPVELFPLRRDGTVKHVSKEFLREQFIENGYYDAVNTARAEGREDPPYALLTEQQIAECSRRYRQFAKDYLAVA